MIEYRQLLHKFTLQNDPRQKLVASYYERSRALESVPALSTAARRCQALIIPHPSPKAIVWLQSFLTKLVVAGSQYFRDVDSRHQRVTSRLHFRPELDED